MPRLKGRHPDADDRLPSKAPIFLEPPIPTFRHRRFSLKSFDRVGFVGLELHRMTSLTFFPKRTAGMQITHWTPQLSMAGDLLSEMAIKPYDRT